MVAFYDLSSEYYVSLTCFLTFNLFAVIGNILPTWLPGVGTYLGYLG
jgi:hypothetical protein